MKKTILSFQQTLLLENLITAFGRVVTHQQIYQQAHIIKSSWQVKKDITKLVTNGWLRRIKRGLYVICDLTNRGFLSLSPYVIANLIQPNSYVSFELALAHHNLFDQLNNKVISISPAVQKNITLNEMKYDFISTQKKYYFGWQKVIIDNHTAQIATIEKALIDMIQFHRSQYSIDLVIEKMQQYQAKIDTERLYDYAGQMSVSTIKILGVIGDLLEKDTTQLYNQAKINRSTHWMFSQDKKFNSKWRLHYDPYFDQYQT